MDEYVVYEQWEKCVNFEGGREEGFLWFSEQSEEHLHRIGGISLWRLLGNYNTCLELFKTGH